MSTNPLLDLNPGPVSDTATRAFALWEHLNEVADKLWADYEKEFLDICILTKCCDYPEPPTPTEDAFPF